MAVPSDRYNSYLDHDVGLGFGTADQHRSLVGWVKRLEYIFHLTLFERTLAGVTNPRPTAVIRAQSICLGEVKDAFK